MRIAIHDWNVDDPDLTGRRRRRDLAPTIATAAATVIVVLDYFTGPYLAFATFYLIPVAVVAWTMDRTRALLFAVFLAVGGTIAVAANPGMVPMSVVIVNGLLRLGMFVFSVLLIQAERAARSRIAALSTTDPLTGLFNRRAFVDLGNDRLRLAARTERPVTLVYADIDGLKSCNDAFGHEAGDRLIVQFADAAVATFREADLLTRIGGDEFCFLLMDTSAADADTALARLRETLARLQPTPILASMGALTIRPDAEVDIRSLMHHADALMYQAKRDSSSDDHVCSENFATEGTASMEWPEQTAG